MIYNCETMGVFDPCPYLLLNLALNCIAASQAPVIASIPTDRSSSMRIARILARGAALVVVVLAMCLSPSDVSPHPGHEHAVQEPSEKPTVLDAIGALHPVAVHFPIALLLTAALSEGILVVTSRESLRDTTRLLVALDAAGAVVSASLGWITASGEAGSLIGEKAELLEWHRWAGTATAALSLVLFFVSEHAARLGGGRATLRAALLAVALAVGTAGYLGGELVHGNDHGAHRQKQ